MAKWRIRHTHFLDALRKIHNSPTVAIAKVARRGPTLNKME